jgi:hypothetical protein
VDDAVETTSNQESGTNVLHTDEIFNKEIFNDYHYLKFRNWDSEFAIENDFDRINFLTTSAETNITL